MCVCVFTSCELSVSPQSGERWQQQQQQPAFSNPPPVPARRQCSQAAADTRPAAPEPVLAPERGETRSAPSSPTEPPKQFEHSLPLAGSKSPPTARPRSMMVETNARLTYATVAFDDSTPHPAPYPRRNTKYSNVVYQQPPTEEELPMATTSSASQPPPTEAETTPTREEGGKQADPFTEDPFAGANVEEWSDPAAFYDKPPPPRPSPQKSEELKQEAIARAICDVTSADFTGESAYEDTSQFLRDIQRKVAGDVLNHEPLRREEEEEEDEGPEYDLPPADLLESVPPVDESEPFVGNYDYPAELSKFPREGGSADEPALHTMNYSKPTPPSSRAVARHELPLPPLPQKEELSGQLQQQEAQAPPPLPARPGAMKPLLPSDQRPPLPPYTVQRKAGAATPTSEDAVSQPPLPPRVSKPNGSSPSPSPENRSSASTATQPPVSNRETAILDLVALGYTRGDVVRALAIVNNDFNMAKKILREFGGRH